MSVTVDEIMTLRPCQQDYPRERVERLFAGRASVTAMQIACEGSVPPADRLWLLLRLAPREAWLPAIYRCVDRALRAAWVLPEGLGEALAATAPPIVCRDSAAWAAREAARAAEATRAEANAAAWDETLTDVAALVDAWRAK